MTITQHEALQRLEAVVATAGPDYKPSGTCRYFNDKGDPECIIGHAFADELRAAGVGVGHKNATSFGGLTPEFDDAGFEFDVQAVHVLRRAQIAQDGGETWGVALAMAKAAVE